MFSLLSFSPPLPSSEVRAELGPRLLPTPTPTPGSSAGPASLQGGSSEAALGGPLTAGPRLAVLQVVDKQPTIKLPDTVSAIMDRWILQMGFPVITVDTQTGTISQQHFLLDPQSVVTRPSQFK